MKSCPFNHHINVKRDVLTGVNDLLQLAVINTYEFDPQ